MTEIVRERGEAYRRQIIGAVTGRFDVSYGAFNGALAKAARRYDMYRGMFTARYHSHRNNIHIPFVLSVIQSDLAKKMNTSFGTWPYVQFKGDPQTARKNDVLISEQFDDSIIFRKGTDMTLTAELYGTSVLQHGWRQKMERRAFRHRLTDPFTGDQTTALTYETAVDFDGPDFQVVDILDCFPQPGHPRIMDMSWFIRRYWMDYDDCRALAFAGIFDRKETERLKDSHFEQDRAGGYAERRYQYRNVLENADRGADKLERPVEIVEMWGTLPDELLNGKDSKSRLVTVGNGIALLRNADNPYWHGQIPFIEYAPIQDPHYFHAISKVEISERLQAAANRIANQQLDAVDLAVDPGFLVNRNLGLDKRKLFMRSGRVIETDGPVDDSNFRTLSPDLRGIQLGYAEIDTLSKWLQQGTGIIEDTVQGLPVSKRQTAREFVGRQEQVNNRLLLETRLAEEAWIEPLAHFYRALNQQFLDLPRELSYGGEHARMNVVTGEQPESFLAVDFEDVNANLRKVRARGATQYMSQFARQENIFRFLQAIGANPAAAMRVNWENFLRYTFLEFDMSTEELLANSPEEMAMNAAALGILPAGGGGPAGGAGGQRPAQPQLAQQQPGGEPGGVIGQILSEVAA